VRAISRLFTLLTVTAIVVGLAALIRSQVRDATVGQRFRAYALFRDGARLAPGSPVVIAGVRVGDITRVSLEGGFARIDLRFRDDLAIPQSSLATRRADKLFGDSYIEIIPGTEPKPALLASGQRILHVIEGSSADTILRGIYSALPKADRAMELTKDSVITARQLISGPLADGLARTQAWLDAGNLQAPITVLDDSVTTIDGLTERAAQALRGAGPSVLGTLDRVDQRLRDARTSIASAQSSVAGIADSTKTRLAELDPWIADTVAALRGVDDPPEADRGILGRLLNDAELSADLDDAAASGADLLRRTARPFRVLLGLRSEYDIFSRAQRFYVGAEVFNRPDSFYYFEVARGPQGGLADVELTDTRAPGYTRTINLAAGSTFTAQFGKRFGPLSLRAGIKESTFGAGADLRLRGRLHLSADLYGSSFSDAPNLKLVGALAVFRSIYVTAGVDNALTAPGRLPVRTGTVTSPETLNSVRYGRDYFVGANIVFDEDDLALLLRVYGALLVGLY
jgi:phospholipid/cholesterol/gamma-HCH transport system substrate-binding protein